MAQFIWPPLSISSTSPIPVTGPLTDTQLRASPVPVSGTVTSNQGTSPWVVSGPFLTDAQLRATAVPVSVSNFPATQPVSGTVTSLQGTSPWIVDGSGSIQPVSGPLTDTQLRATPVPVSGTVAVSNFPATQPVSGTVTALQGTSPWIVDGSAVVQPVSGPLTDTQLRATPVPVSGTVAVSNFPATQPISGTVTANQGTSPWIVDGSGVVQPVSGPLTDTQLRATPVPVSGTVAVSNFPATQPVSGTVAVTQSTSPWVVDGSGFTQPVSGTVATTQSGTWVLGANSGVDIGDVTVNNGAGGAAVNIQDGGNSITVDGTVAISGSVAVTGTFFQATQPVSGTVTLGAGSADIGTVHTLADTPPAGTITQAAITVGTTAVRLTVSGAAPDVDRSVLVATVDPASTAKFYIGSSTVTSTGATRGIAFLVGQDFIANDDAGDYYIISDTAGQTVFVMEQSL